MPSPKPLGQLIELNTTNSQELLPLGQELIGFHNFTGADWGGKYVGISKKTWVGANMKLDESDPVVTCFRQLGESIIPTELVDNDLPPQMKDLERFVCQVYSSTG